MSLISNFVGRPVDYQNDPVPYVLAAPVFLIGLGATGLGKLEESLKDRVDHCGLNVLRLLGYGLTRGLRHLFSGVALITSLPLVLYTLLKLVFITIFNNCFAVSKAATLSEWRQIKHGLDCLSGYWITPDIERYGDWRLSNLCVSRRAPEPLTCGRLINGNVVY